jgi:hypothetical protein
MPLLSRLFGKRHSFGGTKTPEVATPDAPDGSLTITIDASQHIVQAVTVFRNNTAQVVRTFNDLTLKVRVSSLFQPGELSTGCANLLALRVSGQ